MKDWDATTTPEELKDGFAASGTVDSEMINSFIAGTSNCAESPTIQHPLGSFSRG